VAGRYEHVFAGRVMGRSQSVWRHFFMMLNVFSWTGKFSPPRLVQHAIRASMKWDFYHCISDSLRILRIILSLKFITMLIILEMN